MVFRLFEPDGTRVTDEHGHWRWRVTAPPTVDRATGKVRVQYEAVPESDAELAVTRHGSYWPGDGLQYPRGKYSA